MATLCAGSYPGNTVIGVSPLAFADSADVDGTDILDRFSLAMLGLTCPTGRGRFPDHRSRPCSGVRLGSENPKRKAHCLPLEYQRGRRRSNIPQVLHAGLGVDPAAPYYGQSPLHTKVAGIKVATKRNTDRTGRRGSPCRTRGRPSGALLRPVPSHEIEPYIRFGGVRRMRTRLYKGSDAAPYAAPSCRHSVRAAARLNLMLSRE